MHDACHHVDHVYMYGGSDENTDFHVKHIAQTKISFKHTSNTCGCSLWSETTMDADEKVYRVIIN